MSRQAYHRIKRTRNEGYGQALSWLQNKIDAAGRGKTLRAKLQLICYHWFTMVEAAGVEPASLLRSRRYCKAG